MIDRKQELKNKVYKLWVSNGGDDADVDMDSTSGNLALAEAAVSQCMYMSNINELKEFLIDRNGTGEKPKLIVSAPVMRPGAKVMSLLQRIAQHMITVSCSINK